MGALHHPFLFLTLLAAAPLLVSVLGFLQSPHAISGGGAREEAWWRRGPGSWPPACRYKCGRCAPCVAVHVPIQPGRWAAPAEYYPEAWRCKCGNKLYMP